MNSILDAHTDHRTALLIYMDSLFDRMYEDPWDYDREAIAAVNKQLGVENPYFHCGDEIDYNERCDRQCDRCVG